MSEIKRNSEEIVKKFLPDLLILGGIFILSYNFLEREPKGSLAPPFESVFPELPSLSHQASDFSSVLAIMFIAIGLDIAIRYYLSHKK